MYSQELEIVELCIYCIASVKGEMNLEGFETQKLMESWKCKTEQELKESLMKEAVFYSKEIRAPIHEIIDEGL